MVTITGKRKQEHITDWLASPDLPSKRNCLHSATTPNIAKAVPDHTQEDPGIDWKDVFGQWPPTIHEHYATMSGPGASKRSRSQSSYSQSVRDGVSPAAWTGPHEDEMKAAGLIMIEDQPLATITKECQGLCDTVLNKKYPLPDDRSFQADRLRQVFGRVASWNEARVVRDILPIVVPSPELLHIDGRARLDDICEAINAEWTQCDTLCGPRPKPDFVVGISPSAFDKDEIEKLTLSHTSACPNIFPESMYFPFLICEVRSSDNPIREAERQAMHSASIAVRAVVQLYQKVALVGEIDQKILAFSVAHDHSWVKIFGHYAKVDGDKITFFRHSLYSGEFAVNAASQEWAKPYQITRAIYDCFYPAHVARIKHALSQMRGPSLASYTSHLGLEDGSQDSSAESSQEDGRFKKPALPPTLKLQQEVERLSGLLQVAHDEQAEHRQQRDEQREQRAMMERQLAMMERQLAQQKEESREQLAQQKEESREQKAMMERQLAQQKEQMEQQLAQHKEIISLLKQSKV